MAREERLYPDFANGLFAWHLFRYVWALPYAFGRNVLDLGCGSGYGVALLAGVARAVFGVDYDREAVAECVNMYGGLRNVRFAVMDGSRLALDTSRFGLVTCFEVLEHIPSAEVGTALAGIARVLQRGGLFLASTPNRLVEVPHLRSVGIAYDHHVNRYAPRELGRALRRHFSDVRLFGQVPREGSVRRTLRYLDFFNLRHHPLLQGAKAWITRQTLVGQVPTPPGLGSFQVRRDLVRQAGILLALCRK
ncbi:MAG: class I SAM-dependent methyltransferase [candidate division NC10 bacterium]|nr:class I SAM-dependent methyltransferase [candidate division NC10 bacterium]